MLLYRLNHIAWFGTVGNGHDLRHIVLQERMKTPRAATWIGSSQAASVFHYRQRDFDLLFLLVPDGPDLEFTLLTAPAPHNIPRLVGLPKPNGIPVLN
jgi:hypothetical protein